MLPLSQSLKNGQGWTEINDESDSSACCFLGARYSVLGTRTQNFDTCAHEANSLKTSNIWASDPESGAIEYNGTVAAK